MHRYTERPGRGTHPGRIVVGLLLLVWGGIAFLESLGFEAFHGVVRTYWPVILIGWGISGLLSPRRHVLPATAIILLGTVLLGNRLEWWHVTARALGPVIIMGVGLSLLFRRQGHHRRRVTVRMQVPGDDSGISPTTSGGAGQPTGDDSSASLREFALLGGVDRRHTSQAFQGGEVTAVLGGVHVDLRDCRMAGDSAQVEVVACMGGVSFQIPREWSVESHMTAVLGGVDDRSAPPLGSATTQRLVLTGQAVLGGIEIKN